MSALRWTPWAVVLALLLAPATHAGIIYQDDFSGMAGSLNGAMPDVGANNWVASSQFNADGSIVNIGGTGTVGGSATLAFTPVDGLVYTLDASLTGVSAAAGNTNWIGVGFALGQSTLTNSTNRFIDVGTIGKAWMFHRGDPGRTDSNAFLGTATSGAAAGNGVTFSPVFNGGGDIDLRVVLDTTGGAGAWTATWFAKRPTDAAFFQVRPETTLLNETITSVGIAKSNNGVTGNITSFSLTSQVPEPSSAVVLLIGLGSLAMGRYRR